jgi:hypothetical protein
MGAQPARRRAAHAIAPGAERVPRLQVLRRIYARGLRAEWSLYTPAAQTFAVADPAS